MVLLKLLIVIIFSILIFILIKNFVNKNKNYEIKYKLFVSYLKSKNDIESLRKIGALNFMGVEERWYPSYFTVVEYIESKNKEFEDKMFLDYLKEYKKLAFYQIVLLFPALISFGIIYCILVSFIK